VYTADQLSTALYCLEQLMMQLHQWQCRFQISQNVLSTALFSLFKLPYGTIEAEPGAEDAAAVTLAADEGAV
jgi:hypothetical protein